MKLENCFNLLSSVCKLIDIRLRAFNSFKHYASMRFT
jgi:hypothetical protein